MRAFNRIVSLLLAAAIATAGVLAIIEIVAANTDKDPVLVKWPGLAQDLGSNSWKSAGPRVAAIVLIVVGLLLLFFALRRGKPSTVALQTGAADTDMTTTRRSLQRSLSTAATSVDGVADAKAKVKRRKVVVKGRAGTADRDGTQARLQEQLQERLDSLSLAETRRLKVKLAATPDKRTPDSPSGISDDSSTSATGSSGGSDRTPVGVGGGGGGGERRDDSGARPSPTQSNPTRPSPTQSNPNPGFGPGFGSRGSGSGPGPASGGSA